MRFEEWSKQVEELLDQRADDKGYSENGPDGRNELYEFISRRLSTSTHGHALGEIVYKAVRFAATGDPRDLDKIAAWAFLIRRHCGETEE
jgi:hypothetical protein